MSHTIQEKNKALLLKAFETLFNAKDLLFHPTMSRSHASVEPGSANLALPGVWARSLLRRTRAFQPRVGRLHQRRIWVMDIIVRPSDASQAAQPPKLASAKLKAISSRISSYETSRRILHASRFRTCFVNTPHDRKLAPSFISSRSTFSPSSVIAVSPFKSTTSARPFRSAIACRQTLVSSVAQGPMSLPSITSWR